MPGTALVNLSYPYPILSETKEFRRSYHLSTDSAAGLEFLLFLFCVIVETSDFMWADVDTSESLLIIIYLTFFSIQVPQNNGEL